MTIIRSHPVLLSLELDQRPFLKYSLCLLLAIIILGLSTGCTRSSIPVGEIELSPTPGEEEAASIPTFVPFQAEGTFAVVLVPQDEQLIIRNPAGSAGSEVGALEYDAGSVRLTGNTTGLGSSLWVEVEIGQSQTGWVNSMNLTEEVPREVFCADARGVELISAAADAIQREDGTLLAQLVNPRRGLLVRLEWWNEAVTFPPEMIARVFADRTEYSWGEQRGGRFQVSGTVGEVVLPLLDDVLNQSPKMSCGELQIGVSSIEPEWPTEYSNLNYYLFFKAAPEGGNRYNWRSWAFGVEYIRDTPYITTLVHYHGDV